MRFTCLGQSFSSAAACSGETYLYGTRRRVHAHRLECEIGMDGRGTRRIGMGPFA